MLDSTKPGMPYIEEQVTLQDDLYNLFKKKHVFTSRENNQVLSFEMQRSLSLLSRLGINSTEGTHRPAWDFT